MNIQEKEIYHLQQRMKDREEQIIKLGDQLKEKVIRENELEKQIEKLEICKSQASLCSRCRRMKS